MYFFLSPEFPNLWRYEISINTQVTVHFSICLSNHNSLCHEICSASRYNQGQYFSGRTTSKFQTQLKFPNCSNYSIIKCDKFQFLALENSNHKNCLELVSRLQSWTKNINIRKRSALWVFRKMFSMKQQK